MAFLSHIRHITPRFHFAALSHELPALVEGLRALGCGTIIDFAREHRPSAESHRVASVIAQRMHEYPSAMHAIKLSALGAQDDRALAARHATNIAALAARLNTSMAVDAEENSLHKSYSETASALMEKYNAKIDGSSGFAPGAAMPTVFKTYQMYRADSVDELEKDIEIAKNRGYTMGAKLVRGAYLRLDRDSGALLPTKAATDASYAKGLETALSSANGHVMALVATRNMDNIEQALASENTDRAVFAQLLGMDDETTSRLVEERARVFKYVPFGNGITDLTPYLFRRFLERLSWG